MSQAKVDRYKDEKKNRKKNMKKEKVQNINSSCFDRMCRLFCT